MIHSELFPYFFKINSDSKLTITDIFNNNKIVAIIGLSNKPLRPSNRIGRYLLQNNFKVYGVNPNLGGQEIDGIKCFNSLSEVPEKIEIINIFRKPEHLVQVMEDILKLDEKPNIIWAQIGVINPVSKKMAEENQIEYIENKCIMVEHDKLYN